MKKTIGGDRLGAGNKMQVELHGFERSTFDLGYIWRSTMSAGTLVPFMSELMLTGDTWDIDLDCNILTLPTTGPLFGSFKVQLDVFLCPIRLYQGLLHNNALGIGMKMNQINLPIIGLNAPASTLSNTTLEEIDNCQINPSCLLAYFGIRGIGLNGQTSPRARNFNAVPILAYHEIYKNYYANKPEEIGAVIHTISPTIPSTPTKIEVLNPPTLTPVPIPISPATGPVVLLIQGSQIKITYAGTKPDPKTIFIKTQEIGTESLDNLSTGIWNTNAAGTELTSVFRWTMYGNLTAINWEMANNTSVTTTKPSVVTFPLANIDEQRKHILQYQTLGGTFDICAANLEPYRWLRDVDGNGKPMILNSQEGLLLKTYQSDKFNNWIDTEWITGTGGINELTKIDVSSGYLMIDSLIISRKVYDVMNRVAISGGTYKDWVQANWDHEGVWQCESPMYMGGLIKEVIFQEVVSNATAETQDLGTLGGRGKLADKHKGGHIILKADEPSYAIGIISLTPRIDYSQGNKWDVNLVHMDQLHKPGLDQIGYQDLITEQLAWWDVYYDVTTAKWIKKSAGKQPAWTNYMTATNRTHGNFAMPNKEMYMTLNRRYEATGNTPPTIQIKDLTTYIDPSKYNNVFAEPSLDSQNFWAQISVDINARRKMSSKLMPNL